MTQSVPCTPGRTHLGALALVAAHHGLEVSPQEVAAWAKEPEPTLVNLLFLARQLGLRGVPLSGTVAALGKVSVPAVLGTKGGQFRVLLELREGRARIADPETGRVEELESGAIGAWWSGDVVRLTADTDAIAGARRTIRERRQPWRRIPALLGWTASSGAARAFTPLALLVAGSTALDPGPLTWALASAVVLSAWSATLSRACAGCGGAQALVGELALGALGVVLYGASYALVLAGLATDAIAFALAGALGAHATLVALLGIHRTVCLPCFALAGAVAVASVSLRPAGPLAWLLAVAGGAAAMAVVARAAGGSTRERALGAGLEAVGAVCSSGEVPPGRVTVTVWKRAGCMACAYYDAVVRPMLDESFGDEVTIDERTPPAGPFPTPIIVVRGASAQFAFMRVEPAGGADHIINAVRGCKATRPGPRSPFLMLR